MSLGTLSFIMEFLKHVRSRRNIAVNLLLSFYNSTFVELVGAIWPRVI